MSTRLRPVFYGLTLTFAFLETPFSIVTSHLDGFSPYIWIYGKIAGVVSIATWAWIVILLFHSVQRGSIDILTQPLTHVVSFAIFTLVWLALSAMLATQLPSDCNTENHPDGTAYVWCAMGGISTGFACLVFLFSTVSLTLVYVESCTDRAAQRNFPPAMAT